MDEANPADVAILLLTDPYRVFAIGDLLLLIGAALLAAAVVLLLIALPRRDPRPPPDTFLWGGASAFCLAAWAVATGYAQSRARGGLDAVAAMGGWSAAALALLAASILYVAFTVRVGGKAARGGLVPFRWPVYAAVNLVGTASLASTGSGDEWVVTLGLGLTIVLLPLLGVATYRELMEGFAAWRKVGRIGSVTAAGPPAVLANMPPPPND